VAIFTGVLYFGSKWGIKKIMNEAGVDDDDAVGMLDKIYRVIGVIIILVGVFFGSYMFLFHEVRVNESLNPGMSEMAGEAYKEKMLKVQHNQTFVLPYQALGSDTLTQTLLNRR